MVEMAVGDEDRLDVAPVETEASQLPADFKGLADQAGVEQHGFAALVDEKMAHAHHAANGEEAGRHAGHEHLGRYPVFRNLCSERKSSGRGSLKVCGHVVHETSPT